MGRLKHEMMLYQEYEHVIDWYEDTYCESAPEIGTPEWDTVMAAYTQMCQERDREEMLDYYQGQLEWFLYQSSPLSTFESQMRHARQFLSFKVYGDAEFSLVVMLHAHIVASLEAYLSAKFIQVVTGSNTLTRTLIETDPAFSKKQVSMRDIYTAHEKIQLEVASYLRSLIFHKLSKTKEMYLGVLDCDFGDVNWLFKAIEIRHDCTHRAGLTKDGAKAEITNDSVKDLIYRAEKLVELIEKDVSNKDEHQQTLKKKWEMETFGPPVKQ